MRRQVVRYVLLPRHARHVLEVKGILKLVRATHLGRPVTAQLRPRHRSCKVACMILGISAEGTPKTLRMRIAQHMSCMTVRNQA